MDEYCMLNTMTHTRRAFTLIELLVVIVILSVITVGAVAGYGIYNNSNRVKQTALTLKNNLRLAQSNATTARKPESGCTKLNGYKVSFTANSYTMVPNCDNDVDVSENEVQTVLNTGLTFSPVPSSFIFNVLTAGTTIAGTETIRISGYGKFYSVNVLRSGDIIDLGFTL
jgi:prepilin-type N-terminal cleavage/methylation domain-containing protein